MELETGLENQKTKYPDCLAYCTICLVCNLSSHFRREQVLSYIPNGSVELVHPSAEVCLELALALIQPVSHLDLVMPNSAFDHVWLGLGL